MLKIRFNPLIGILIFIAGMLVFAGFAYIGLTDEEWEWPLLAIVVVNLGVGYFLATNPNVVFKPDALEVKNKFGKLLISYPMDKNTWLAMEGDKLLIVKGSSRVEVQGVSKSDCNENDWEVFRGVIEKKGSK